MCGGVKYTTDGHQVAVYFPQPNAALPVRRRDGTTDLVTWGRRLEEEGALPKTGWARLDSITAGKWDKYQPRPALIKVDEFMEKDVNGVSHWYMVTKGQYIQGLLAREGEEIRVYVVTISPPDPEAMSVHDRWPRMVTSL